MAEERHGMALVVGALIGSIAGTAYGLLNAPQPGWRTRADLTAVVEEWGDRIANQIAGVVTEVQAFTGTTPVPPVNPDAQGASRFEFSFPDEVVAVEIDPASGPVATREGVVAP